MGFPFRPGSTVAGSPPKSWVDIAEVVRTTGATQATLLSDLRTAAVAPPAAPAARKPVPVAAAPLPPPAPEGHTVSVVRGTRLTEQQFVRSGERGWIERGAVEKR